MIATIQQPLPSNYTQLSDHELFDRIQAAKKKLGSRLVILGHHYQRNEIIVHADYRGDSYKLAKDAGAHPDAEYVVFCGVHFMAESADILTTENQIVILPNMAAGCSMADMANLFQVKSAWKQLGEILGTEWIQGVDDASAHSERVVPVTYVNSTADLKAFVGKFGGTCCTSTNAPAAVSWALDRGQKVLFFPDQHLGRNTGVNLGYDPTEMVVWDPFVRLGGNTPEAIRNARFILWKGHCSVHQRFTVEQINKAREEHPGVQIMVHPECTLEVVRAADHNGSTEGIIRTVTESPAGSVWGIGTEINLVQRLASELLDKTIFCLDPMICPCSTMYRIHPSFLCWVLEELADGRVMNQVAVPEEVAVLARLALHRMLRV